jgi:hypothetical protein
VEPLTEAQRKELDELKEVLRQEMTASDDVVKTAKKDLEDLKPNFLAALQHAVDHGNIDQRSKIAMWGYGKLLEESKADADPIRRLIEGMPAPDAQGTEGQAEEAGASTPDARDASV